MAKQLTQPEIEKLLEMLKISLKETVNFPTKGNSVEFDLIGDSKTDIFINKIYRGKINPLKYNFGARIKKDGILLLELHINPNNVHTNPDGSKIVGNHWHIFTEEHGRKLAYLAEDIDSEKFVENTVLFLEKFNVIKLPSINYQQELI